MNLGREWTVDPGYRWRPSEGEWRKIVTEQGEAIRQRYGIAADLYTPEGRKQLLDYWLTTPEEDFQVVPTGEADALVSYLVHLNKTEVPLQEAKE